MFNLQGEYSQFLIIGIMFVLVYVLMIRPQQRKQKEQKEMLAAIAIDDEIITTGGLFGRVVSISENHVKLEIAQGEVFLQKVSIAAVLPKGTLASLEPSPYAPPAVEAPSDSSPLDPTDDTSQKP